MNYLVSAFGHRGLVPVFEVRKNDNPKRFMDPKNDIYPQPLITRSESYRVKGFDKIQFAVFYLQPERLGELIKHHQDDYLNINDHDLDTKYVTKENIYKMLKTHDFGSSDNYLLNNRIDIYTKLGGYGNILSVISQGSLPSNIPHAGNEFLFDRMFMTVIKSLKSENISQMVGDLNDGFPSYEAHLYKFILLNFGAMVKDNENFLSRLKTAYMTDLDETYVDNILSFYTSGKLGVVLSSRYPVGKKLLSLLDQSNHCSITGEEFKYPVIIEDGTIYEKKGILEWFERGNTSSPLTGIELKTHWIMYSIIENEIIYANNKKIFPVNVQKYIK